MSFLKYKYYDTPEGQDIYKKTFALSKIAAASGMAFATYDVLMFSHPKGALRTIGRYAWFLGPMVGMASAFTVTANVACNVRHKDDKWNYFLGGVTAGSVFGAWIKNVAVAVPIAVIIGAVAVVKKTAVEEGWQFFPETNEAHKSAVSVRHDWTLVKDIDELKTWSTGKQ